MCADCPDSAVLPAAFSAFYTGIFGERWPQLVSAMRRDEPKIPFTEGLEKPYYLSAASVAAASALLADAAEIPQDNPVRILDLCAAPGGKTLVLASGMKGNWELVANEYSAARRNRLCHVLDEHLPPDRRSRIRVTGFDGAKWCRYERACFDFILLDAPCSAERHVLADNTALSRWTPARVRNLAVRQWSLLSGAWLLLRPGGRLVYSTCALASAENSGVVERLCKKYPGSRISFPADGFFSRQPLSALTPEFCSAGVRFLPDRSAGSGPIFFSVLDKPPEPANGPTKNTGV